MALRTQQILAHEAGGTDTADPLGGAYFIETLTRELEERAWELIERVDELGGAVAAIEAGFVQREIEDAAFEHERGVQSGERAIVGVNRYAEGAEDEIELHSPRSGVGAPAGRADERACEPSATARAAEAALARVRETARGTENLLPPMREALAAHCTVGEICTALREEFGTYDAHQAP